MFSINYYWNKEVNTEDLDDDEYYEYEEVDTTGKEKSS